MTTAEMRLLTVPQFARRVQRSEDEVLEMIQTRDVKALRPDPEGGYRVLETEVDRILQVHTTRIKPKKVERNEGPDHSAGVPRSVPLEAHLTTVTALETARDEKEKLERLNSKLQAELFQYLTLADESRAELIEARARMEATHQRLLVLEREKLARDSAPWWKRLFNIQ